MQGLSNHRKEMGLSLSLSFFFFFFFPENEFYAGDTGNLWE